MTPYGQWPAYVPVAARRRAAAAEAAAMARKGIACAPVVIAGRQITTTLWGNAWCTNLERYSDYSSRLPRGRTYVRNGSVVDLAIAPGSVRARVSGSRIYTTTITVKPLPAVHWTTVCTDCAGGIDSLVELLQGRFATGVMERLCRQGDGLFPAPADIAFDCSCPDDAIMCKHVAAVLYGVGARFDLQPELLFTLRQVDASALLAKAGSGLGVAGTSSRALAPSDVAALFDLDMDGADAGANPSGTPLRLAPPQTRDPAARVAPSKRSGRTAGRPPPAERARSIPAVGTVPARGRRKRGGPVDPAALLLTHLRTHRVLDNASGRSATGLDSTAVRLLLQQLVAAGHARVVGRKRGTRYLPMQSAQRTKRTR